MWTTFSTIWTRRYTRSRIPATDLHGLTPITLGNSSPLRSPFLASNEQQSGSREWNSAVYHRLSAPQVIERAQNPAVQGATSPPSESPSQSRYSELPSSTPSARHSGSS